MKNLVIIGLLFMMMGFVPAYKSNNSIVKTSLQVTILDELGNPVEGANVQLYKTDEDYRESKNPVTEKLQTDKKGKVTFKDLEEAEYYVYAEKDDLNNDGGGAKTEKMQGKKINKVTIIIS